MEEVRKAGKEGGMEGRREEGRERMIEIKKNYNKKEREKYEERKN